MNVYRLNPRSRGKCVHVKKSQLPSVRHLALWSAILLAGILAAAAGKIFVGSGSHLAIFYQAIALGAVLALVAHAMIPESIHEGGSLVVLPTVAGFLFALWLALVQSFV
jgi:hypothetical protein